MRSLGALSQACTLAMAIASFASHARAEDRVGYADTKPGYVQLFATALIGDGLRFNNPYRLATPLGSDAESVSRTARYIDFGAAVTLGDPFGLQQGAALRFSRSIEGVDQWTITPSYFLYRRWRALAAFGRAGVSIATAPDLTWGLEASAGAAYFVRGGIGVAAEVVGDVFYGEGTRDVRVAAYPVLSAQLGLIVTYEVLP